MRQLGIAALWLALVALVSGVVLGGSARAGLLRQDDATPAASPAAPIETDTVTLVAGYLPDATGDLLILRPIETGGDALVDLSDDEAGIGQVDFTAVNESLPRITIGDSTFDAYIRFEGDPEGGLRWTWFFDTPGVRPATLVVQVAATAGPYNGYNGTATFVSREENGGGVLVIVLNPPEETAAETPAAEAPAAETPAAGTGDTAASEAVETPATDETPAASTRRP